MGGNRKHCDGIRNHYPMHLRKSDVGEIMRRFFFLAQAVATYVMPLAKVITHTAAALVALRTALDYFVGAAESALYVQGGDF